MTFQLIFDLLFWLLSENLLIEENLNKQKIALIYKAQKMPLMMN
jgi:hypothetical protein